MSVSSLRIRLFVLAIEGLKEANRGNVFISKAEAMRSVNNARRLAR